MQHLTSHGIHDDTEKTNTLTTLSSLHQADDKSLHIFCQERKYHLGNVTAADIETILK
jgi:hypothetical protein